MSPIWKKRLEAGYSGAVPLLVSGEAGLATTAEAQNGLDSSPC
jgi:hypothetical protein